MNHTPLPWELNGLEIQATNKQETSIAEIFEQNEFAKENGTFIITACNEYDKNKADLNQLAEMNKNQFETIKNLKKSQDDLVKALLMAVKCIQVTEEEKFYSQCAVSTIGKRTLEIIEEILTKEGIK